MFDCPVSPPLCERLNLARFRIHLVNTVPIIALLKVLGGERAEGCRGLEWGWWGAAVSEVERRE